MCCVCVTTITTMRCLLYKCTRGESECTSQSRNGTRRLLFVPPFIDTPLQARWPFTQTLLPIGQNERIYYGMYCAEKKLYMLTKILNGKKINGKIIKVSCIKQLSGEYTFFKNDQLKMVSFFSIRADIYKFEYE